MPTVKITKETNYNFQPKLTKSLDKSSASSFDEYRTTPSGCRPSDQAN